MCDAPATRQRTTCRILSLDGGGAKGFYTFGVLREVEALLGGGRLCGQFDLIFGTSTGGIIAALLALGHTVQEVHALYKQHVPKIMGKWLRRTRSAALNELAKTVFDGKTFNDMRTGVGIVATHWDLEKPMIFKSSVAQAHGLKHTFQPGFGVSVADAIKASCSAYPLFEKTTVTIQDGTIVTLIDGGFCANNPTLYAIADAVRALGRSADELRVVSIGVGNYPSPSIRNPRRFALWCLKWFRPVQLLQKTLNVNTVSMEQLRLILFKNIATVRIDESFTKPELATDLIEHDLGKLNLLFLQGRESYAKHEEALKSLLLGDIRGHGT